MRAAGSGRGRRGVRRRRGRPRRSRRRRPRPVREDLRRHRRRRASSRPSAPAPTRSASTSCRARRARSRSTRPWPWRASLGPRRPPTARAADRRRHRRRRRPRSWPRSPATVDPDAIQLTGDEPPDADRRRSRGRPGRSLHLPAEPPADSGTATAQRVVGRGPRATSPPAPSDPPRHGRRPASRAGPGTGVPIRPLAAAVAREVPVVLAGGLDPANVGAAVLGDPGRRRRRRVGRRGAARRRRAAAQGPAPRRPVRQAGPRRPPRPAARRRRARRRSTPGCSRPTPPAAGAIDRAFGGRYVPETLMAALEQLERAYAGAPRRPPASGPSCASCLATYAGRPTPLYRADRLAADALATRGPARTRGGAPTGCRRPCGSTSSARTSPTPAPTRSTTRSARRC